MRLPDPRLASAWRPSAYSGFGLTQAVENRHKIDELEGVIRQMLRLLEDLVAEGVVTLLSPRLQSGDFCEELTERAVHHLKVVAKKRSETFRRNRSQLVIDIWLGPECGMEINRRHAGIGEGRRHPHQAARTLIRKVSIW